MLIESIELNLLWDLFRRLDLRRAIARAFELAGQRCPGLVPLLASCDELVVERIAIEITRVVAHANQMMLISAALTRLGRENAGINISSEHVGVFADALVEAVREQASGEWNEQLEWIWTASTQTAATLFVGGLEQAQESQGHADPV